MDAQQLQDKLRTLFGWRIGDHTAAYILKKLADPKAAKSFPILAHDARTGQPICPTLNPRDLDDWQPSLF